MHDSEAFKKSGTYAEAEDLFSGGRWLWADSAYPSTTWCVPPYKRPEGLQPRNAKFNYHLSRVGVSDTLRHVHPMCSDGLLCVVGTDPF